MADAHAHALEHPISTGIDNRKLAIWTFIGSECLFFASLISTYLVYKGKSLVGPLPHATSQCMLHGKMQDASRSSRSRWSPSAPPCCSSARFFVVLALNGCADRATGRSSSAGSSLTVLCGFFFIGMQVYEFTTSTTKGWRYTTNLFGVELLHADRVPRQPRDARRDLAADGASSRRRGVSAAGQGAEPRDRGALLALRRRGLDRDLPRRLPDELLRPSWTPATHTREHHIPERAGTYVKVAARPLRADSDGSRRLRDRASRGPCRLPRSSCTRP